jgi:hypothetical protein
MSFMKNWVLLLSLLFTAAPLSLFSNDSNSTIQQVSLEIYPKWYSQDNITISRYSISQVGEADYVTSCGIEIWTSSV